MESSSKMVMGYQFQFITKDGKKLDSYQVGVFLDPGLLGIREDPYLHHEPDIIELTYGVTEVLEAQSAKVQKYIEDLKEQCKKNPSEGNKKELKLLENTAAIIVTKKLYNPHCTR
jgi:hypothetical protein